MFRRYSIIFQSPNFWFIILIAALSSSCNNHSASVTVFPDSNQIKGRELAVTYCQSCHLLPDPSLLNKKSWEKGVLPAMGPFLGIFEYQQKIYPSYRFDRNLKASVYPKRALVDTVQWQHIIDYYVKSAPDSLPAAKRQIAVMQDPRLFKILTPSHSYPAGTCFVAIDSVTKRNTIVIADALSGNIYRYDKRLQVIDSFAAGNPVSDVAFETNGYFICSIGSIKPDNRKRGSVKYLKKNFHEANQSGSEFLLDQLARPVQVTAADLKVNGRKTFLVSEFGNLTGSLTLLEDTGRNQFVRHELISQAGAIQAIVNDYNHDGLPDIWALFAQGNEGIYLLTNQDGGKFGVRQILRFPPVYGSSSFELDDFNKDGYPDILYSCGDNADFSPVLKPYHGVYIFINDGKNNFTQRWFFPINGCYKAMARDFDGDGDLDIAAISFFADYRKHPEEGFFFLENEGDFRFQPYTSPELAKGRWMTMSCGDLDGDGREDIILGNNLNIARNGTSQGSDKPDGPPFVILKNERKKIY